MRTNLKMKFTAVLIFALCSLMASAATLFPDSKTASNNIELGVEGVSRLCPTGMWDHWTFRDIVYDKENNTVVFLVQLNNWDAERDDKKITEADAKKQTEWIVENIMKGYDGLIKSPQIMCDGDFMLYLSLGTLLKQMEHDGATLRIALLKPDYENLAIRDIPMKLTTTELKSLITR